MQWPVEGIGQPERWPSATAVGRMKDVETKRPELYRFLEVMRTEYRPLATS